MMAQLAVHLRAHVAAKNELLLKKKAESSGNIARQHLRLFLVGSAKFHCETHLRLAYTNRVLCLAQILLMDKLVLYTFAPFRNSTYIVEVCLIITPQSACTLITLGLLVTKLQPSLVSGARIGIGSVLSIGNAETLDQAEVVPQIVCSLDDGIFG
jgi:hypothetical protein